MDLDSSHEEVDSRHCDINPELVEVDLENGPAEEPIPNGNVSSSHSGREASGSELSSAANAVITAVDVSTFSHTLNDSVPEDIILDDADPIEEESNGLSSGIHDPSTPASASSLSY